MKNRRIWRNGSLDAQHWIEPLVDHHDALRRLAGDLDRRCRHRCNRVALVESLLVRESVVARVAHVEDDFAAKRDACGVLRDVRAGNDRLDTRHSFGGSGVDGHNARVSMRAPKEHAVQHAWQREVGSVVRPAGDLIHSVVTDRTRADVLILGVAHAVAPLISAAASRTARTILS
jgi:hypothetical protein